MWSLFFLSWLFHRYHITLRRKKMASDALNERSEKTMIYWSYPENNRKMSLVLLRQTRAWLPHKINRLCLNNCDLFYSVSSKHSFNKLQNLLKALICKCKKVCWPCCRQTFSFYFSFFRTNNRASPILTATSFIQSCFSIKDQSKSLIVLSSKG